MSKDSLEAALADEDIPIASASCSERRRLRCARATDDKTPEDHIGLMLVLMSHLCRTQPESLDDYLCGHLLTWAPHYLEELAVAARHPFYRGLAELTRSTLLGIQDFRGLSVKLPRFYK